MYDCVAYFGYFLGSVKELGCLFREWIQSSNVSEASTQELNFTGKGAWNLFCKVSPTSTLVDNSNPLVE